MSFVAIAAILMVACADDTPTIHIDIDEVRESSDLQPIDGVTSAGQPDADAFAVVAEAGYVAVIDLRGPDEDRGLDEPAVLEKLGLEYVTFPLVKGEGINMENARKLDDVLSRYDGPVLVHCASGNRVGAMLALRHSLHGADDKVALAYGKSAGLTRLESTVKEQLKQD